MMEYITKDVTTVEYGIVAHGCNCQGVMGSGVAKGIRAIWPEAYERYTEVCRAYGKDQQLLGLAHFVTVKKTDPKIIVANLFTQDRYGSDGKVYADRQAIAIALEQVFMMSNTMNMPIYMPKIGCGLGGLDWNNDVKPIVEELVNSNPECKVYICDI